MEGSHLVPLHGGWAIWRRFCLRSTGFPADRVLSIGIAELEQQVAELDQLTHALAARKAEALAACDELARDCPRERIEGLRRFRKLVRSVNLAAGTEVPPELVAAVERLDRANRDHAAGLAELARGLPADQVRIHEALQVAVRDDRFREALAWQSQAALHGSVDALLQPSEGRKPSRVRQGEQLVASYLQRYCVKNDSIGFFGPISWATIDDAEPRLRVLPGRELLARRTVYFEYWPIEALASKIGSDPALRVWWAPRRVPTVRFDGNTMFLSPERSSPVSDEQASLFAACDGERTAHEIAVARIAAGAASRSEDVYAELEVLQRSGAIDWSLEVPTERPHPERELRAQLERIGDEQARESSLRTLAELVDARDAVTRAAGSSEAVDQAIGLLSETFERLTDMPASRRGGKTYAARQLVYEDCVRDVEVVVGPALFASVAPALSLVLTSARWFCHAIAARYRALFTRTYRTLCEQTGSSVIDASRFVVGLGTAFAGNQYQAPPVVQEVKQELRRRWAQLLGTAEGSGPIQRSAHELSAAVAEAFDAPGPGWPLARYQSPDLLFAAASVEALRAGDFLAVLGEVHPGLNAGLNIPPLALQAPSLDDLIALRRRDVPQPSINPVISKNGMDRASVRSLLPDDLHIELGAASSWRARSQVMAIADLVVESVDGVLRIRSRAGDRDFDAIAFFEQYLIVASAGQFSLLPGGKHTPRVTIDNLVIARERWEFSVEEMPFVQGDARPDRAADALRWARAHGLPRFVFVKTPEEPKPFYVDFTSSPLVELLTRAARQATVIAMSEMLPAHGQHWLPDAEGNRYACELRTMAVDPSPWTSV